MRKQRFLILVVAVVALVSLGVCWRASFAEEKLDPATILAEAKASFEIDQRKLEKARLQGSFDIAGKDGKVDTRLFSTFECWVWGDMLRNNSTCDMQRSTFPYARYEDIRCLLLDDDSLYVTTFSERFQPIGCQTRILRVDSPLDVHFDTHYTVWYPPSVMLKLAFDPTRDGVESMTFRRDPRGMLHGEWSPRKGIRVEVELDPQIGNRAISNQIYVGDKLSHDIRVTWKPWAGGGIMLESVENTSTADNKTYRWTLTEFESLKVVPGDKFQPSDLHALPGSRIIDARDPDNVLVNRQPKP